MYREEGEKLSLVGSYQLPTPEHMPEEQVWEQRRLEMAGAELEDLSVLKNLRERWEENK